MARILFGNMVADARGKLGGIVYSRNTGALMRGKRFLPSSPGRRRSSIAQPSGRGIEVLGLHHAVATRSVEKFLSQLEASRRLRPGEAAYRSADVYVLQFGSGFDGSIPHR